MELNWGPKYGYIWFGSCILTAIWVFFFLPETKDRTLEEIDELVKSFCGRWVQDNVADSFAVRSACLGPQVPYIPS